VRTLGALAALDDATLAEWFGERQGPHLRRLALFEDEREITLSRASKSESRETTFDHDLNGLPALEPVLAKLAEQLCTKLVAQGAGGRTIGIKVRLDDFSTHTRARSQAEATNDVEVVRGVALTLLREFDPPRPVRLLGVRVAGLDEAERPSRRLPRVAAAGQLELSV
jgi:DNA polymerase-4